MIQAADISKIVLPPRVNLFSKAQPRALWAVGDAQIVRRPLLGIVSARQVDPDLALKSDELVKQLAILNRVGFIGGWHSQLETQSLRLLLSQKASLVVCLAKALDRFKPSAELEELVSQNKALVLSHCTPNAKR
ncbi:MAG TPA: hypothetical protein VF452_00415, partial [Candidatus Binatia bacterium]